jgi:hypothetical protein
MKITGKGGSERNGFVLKTKNDFLRVEYVIQGINSRPPEYRLWRVAEE